MKSPTSCQGQATLLVQGARLGTFKCLIKTHCKSATAPARLLSQYESVRGGRHSGVAFMGRRKEREESPQNGHLLAQVTVCL